MQAQVEEDNQEVSRAIVKIKGSLIEFLGEMDPSYKEYVTYENNVMVLYVNITRAMYGLLESAILC